MGIKAEIDRHLEWVKMTTLNLSIKSGAETFHSKGKYETLYTVRYDFIGKELEKVISKGIKVKRSIMGERLEGK